jgi:enamine deaminase RidA (YjgF/YER057c/UK114 family)
MSEYLPQLINPDGLYDPTPNGYSHIAIAPPEAKIIYISGQGGGDKNGNLSADFAVQHYVSKQS